MLLEAIFLPQWSHLLVGFDSGVARTKLQTLNNQSFCLSSKSRCRLFRSFGDYVALAPRQWSQDVGTQVIEAFFQPPVHLTQPFQPFKDVGTSLPSPEKALSFNSAAMVTSVFPKNEKAMRYPTNNN